MQRLAQTLAQDFSFVRVNFNLIGQRLYFSELTFTPSAGLWQIDPPEYLQHLGALWQLERRPATGSA